MSQSKNFRYSLNKNIRRLLNWAMRALTIRSTKTPLDIHNEEIKKILLVRANFRMGDLILATPAILAFRQAFPQARIDFVGAHMSATLFKNLPIDHHFSITRRFPQASWLYLALIKRLRSTHYDLAIDLSCSQSAMGAFIAGFSGARFRIGLQGEWDRWFNVRVTRPPEKNKYRILPAFLKALGLDSAAVRPSLVLSSAETEEAIGKIKALAFWPHGPNVGVFVGGRKARKKRWPVKDFCELITALHYSGINVVVFIGPEEKNLIGYYRDALDTHIALVFEAKSRDFAAMVSRCELFVSCDSGPMHLACALGTRTVAIFQKPNFDHWGPLPALGRVVYQPGGCSAEHVLDVCLRELSHKPRPDLLNEGILTSSRLRFLPSVDKAARRFESSILTQTHLSFSRFAQAIFVLALVIYAWFFPPSGLFEDDTWSEAFSDTLGIGSLVAGGFFHVWAASYIGVWTGPQRLKAPILTMRGPYAYVRHPLYVANLIISAGILILLEAFPLVPLLLILAAWQRIFLINVEEAFLKEKLGEGYELYSSLVPACIPNILPHLRNLSFGRILPAKELGNISALLAVASCFEWLESPLHRHSLMNFCHWLTQGVL